MNSHTRELTFSSREEQSMVLARVIAAQLRSGIERNNKATLVVSGGSTPIPMFESLSQLPLAWDKVTVLLADERQVAIDHEDSNTRLVQKHLLQAEAASATYLPLWDSIQEVDQNLARCEQQTGSLAEPFDVVVLGMGNDGHTASLFPCADRELLTKAMDLNNSQNCATLTPATAPHQRITLTLQRLLNAKQHILHISGAQKKRVLQDALDGDDIYAMPIRAFLQVSDAALDVYWAE